MTESPIPYGQIASAATARIATLNETFAVAEPHKAIPFHYVPGVLQEAQKKPELIPTAFTQYDELVCLYNSIASHQETSPLLTLFPHSAHMRDLLQRINISSGSSQLPTLQQLATDPGWNSILTAGVEDAASHIETGNCIDAHNSNVPEAFAKWLGAYSIVSPARADLDSKSRLDAINGHVVERIYLAWLKERGYEGIKDEVLSVFDEMVQYAHIIGNPSPLEEAFLKLRWIKPEKMEALRKKFDFEDPNLPGSIPLAGLDPHDHPGEIFTEAGAVNLYEDPNPTVGTLLARHLHEQAKRLADQHGISVDGPISLVLDTGHGITTVTFDKVDRDKSGNKERSCHIQTYGPEISGRIAHFRYIETPKNDTCASDVRMAEKTSYEVTYGKVDWQILDAWQRTFVYEEDRAEFDRRPPLPTVIRIILDQIKGVPVDVFALEYPDQTPRGIAATFLRQKKEDLVVDAEQDIVLYPAPYRRYFSDLPSDHVIMKKTSLKHTLDEARKQCTDSVVYGHTLRKIYESRYGHKTH